MLHQNFGRNACEVNGVGPSVEPLVKADFQAMSTVLVGHFSQHDFLLGPRPCLADFALAGAFKAHYTLDPEPRSWLGKHESVLSEYTNRFFQNSALEPIPWLEDDQLPARLMTLMDYLQSSYFPFAIANKEAVAAKQKYLNFNYGGFGKTRARTSRRLNSARLHVADELNRCGAQQNAAIKSYYSNTPILDYGLF